MEKAPAWMLKYKVGDLLYINDSLTRVSRRVTRVKIVALYSYGGRRRYQCVLVRHAGHDKYTEVGPPRVIREEVLTFEPHSRRAGPRVRATRLKRCRKRN